MASSKLVLLLAVVVAAVACLASLASATQYVVGDQCGWKKDISQTGWANGKTFAVGDTLQFNYEQGKHSVVQVSEADYNACNKDGNHFGEWCSGNDVVQLTTPGKAFFICTKGKDMKHCREGMKLAIDVAGPPTIGGGPPPPSGWPFYPGMSPPPPPPSPIGWPYQGTTPPPPPYYGWVPPPPLGLAPPSAAVRNQVGGAVAVVAAAVVVAVAALAF